MGLDFGPKEWENHTMSATVVREKRQTTLPSDVSEAAGLKPGDQVDWRFEDGEIRGRKLAPVPKTRLSRAEVVRRIQASKLTFSRDWEEMRKDTREP